MYARPSFANLTGKVEHGNARPEAAAKYEGVSYRVTIHFLRGGGKPPRRRYARPCMSRLSSGVMARSTMPAPMELPTRNQ